jgi:uncharacterized membrane protein
VFAMGETLGGRVGWSARVKTAVVGSLVLTTWDLFLDPQMVSAGHWHWLATPGPWLNGIPLTNTVGWFVVGGLMIAALDAVVTEHVRLQRGDRLIWAVLAWVWFSEIFGHLVFFHRPWVAATGGVATTFVAWIVVRGKSVSMRVPASDAPRPGVDRRIHAE